jgi:hypothetical protein
VSNEQRQAHLLLQRSDLLTERRLTDEQAGRRVSDVEVPGPPVISVMPSAPSSRK